MASNCAISIIIPTYNVESYIARCLESCINQTLRDIEILVIDDCGSDSSIQIAQHYAQRDCRIRIIHNANNLGTFATRIVGIRQARGEYVLFVDADDYLHLQACELLYKHSTRASILHFKAHYTAAPKAPLLAKLTHYTRYALPTRFSKAPLYNEQIAYNFFLDSRQFPKFTLWDKCYKASLLRQACGHFTDSHFTPIVADDLLFFLVIASLATSYISLDKRLYFYCLNTHSSMQNPSKRARRIESFSYVANALHTLELDSSLLPQITRTMSQDLAALIILESRLLDSRASTPSSAQSVKIARRGGGSARIYTSSTHAPCGSWAYPSTQDSKVYALYPLTLSALLHSIAAVLGTLPYLYSYVCLYCLSRGCQALNLESSNGDSALRDKSAILRGGLAHYRLDKSLRPPLENANFSSQNKGYRSALADVSLEILESQSGVGDCASGNHSPDCLHFRAVITDKVTPTLKCKQNKQSTTAILRILEEEKQAQSKNTPSSRDLQQHGVAIHNPQNAKVDSSEAPFLSLRENPQGFSWQSISAQADSKQNAQNLTTPQAEAKVDSSNDYSVSAECVDCHANASALDRNDSKLDFTTSATILNNSAQDSRICDEKPLLFKRVQGRILGVCNRSTRAEIKGLSRKAESTKKAESPLSLKVAYAAA